MPHADCGPATWFIRRSFPVAPPALWSVSDGTERMTEIEAVMQAKVMDEEFPPAKHVAVNAGVGK